MEQPVTDRRASLFGRWSMRHGLPAFLYEAVPVNNLHSHAQPMLALLRVLGVEPTPSGTLAVGGGGHFASRTFCLHTDGHGSLEAQGAVGIESRHGRATGGPGVVRW